MPSRRARRAPAAPAPPVLSPGIVRLVEPPTGHAVCRSCGRIVRLELDPADAPNLEAFADRRPDGWSVGAVSLTLTGLCAQCSAGATAHR
ncbi:MAG: hypothetical protein L3K18_03995 [Thermoplasmata archaeon]|nr:hypothetical protein [Thermoplasmata archaeon]